MADTKLTLGDFEFQEFEIPASIAMGGEQALVVHKLPGGVRIVQAMGRDDAPISWSGSIYSPDALQRMRQLDLMRAQGEPQVLSLFGFNFLVVIRSFLPHVERAYRVQYSIELTVVVDNTQAQPLTPAASADTAIRSDTSAAVAYGVQIGDSPLNTALSSLNSAVAGVANFQTATQAMLNVVRNPAASASLRISQLANSANTVLGASAALGGVVSGVPAGTSAAALAQQMTASEQLAPLYNAQAAVGRLMANLDLLNPASGGQSVTVAGGNLYDVAKKVYSDATKWATLAQANGIEDPMITSVQTITVPLNPPDTGGLFSE